MSGIGRQARWVLQGTLWTVLSASALLAQNASDAVLARTGIVGGLYAFPRATVADAPLALALAARSNVVVHVQAADEQAAMALREAADRAGLLGRSIYVEQGGDGQSGKLPFADRLVDVLVATDLRDADLTPERRAEWRRVLAPVRGAALVGRAKSAGNGLSESALKSWIKELPLARVIADDTGLWALLKTDLPAGSDAWTHRSHAPDNNQVSMDTTFQAPFLPQWFGYPLHEGFWGTTVVSGNGRLFTLRASRNKNSRLSVTARSLTSGVVLWQKTLTQVDKQPQGGFVSGRSCVAVDGDTLWLVRSNGVARLDAETGAHNGFIIGPRPDGQVKWMAVGKGLLSILSGDPEGAVQGPYQLYTTNAFGRQLAVYRAADGQELWRATVAGGIDQNLIARRDHQLYYLEHGVGVACRDLASGAVQWHTESDTNLVTSFAFCGLPRAWGEQLISQPALLALDDVLLFRSVRAANMFALSRANGATLWSQPARTGNCSPLGRALVQVAMDGKWITGVGSFDLKTGKKSARPALQGLGAMDCTVFTATPNYLISGFGAVRELTGGVSNWLRNVDLKAPCDEGTIVSEGMMASVASECGCTFPVLGYRTLASAGAMNPAQPLPAKERLVSRDTREPAALDVGAADWPTYRHDAQRSGGTPAVASEQAKLLWRFSPAGAVSYRAITNAPGTVRLAPDFLPTAPVAAAGLVWFGTPDGQVRCLRADSGKLVWSFPTAGPLFAPPTLWKGRLLVGGGDGRVYCLDASTGACLWKFLAAPHDRRIFWYGHLINSWPLFGGVVVQNDIAYTVAGCQKDGGVRAYALNSRNGQVIWERGDIGDGFWVNPKDDRSLNPLGLDNNGGLAVDDQRLWVASYPRGGLDLRTGDHIIFGESIGRGRFGSQFGSQIGVLGNWVLQGGRKLSQTQDAVASGIQGGGEAAAFNDRNSTNRNSYILSPGVFSLPVWDADLVVLTGPLIGANNFGSARLTAVPRKKLLARLETSSAANIKDWGADKAWETTGLRTVAYALSPNLVVAAHVNVSGSIYTAKLEDSHLTAFRRADAATAWSVALPEQPLMGGLAIDRDGRVLVSLCDGSVVCYGK
jgi:outer membrane protein assembly factor BamB